MTLRCSQGMNGVPQVEGTDERLAGRRVRLRQEVTHGVLWHITRQNRPPSEVLLQGTSAPHKRVQLWAGGWQPHALHVFGSPQVLGGVGAPVIQAHDGQVVREGVGEGIHAQLELFVSQSGECQAAALAWDGGDGARDIEPFEPVLARPQRLDPTDGEPMPAYGHSPPPAVVLAEDAHGAGIRWRHDARQPLLTRHLKLLQGVSVLWCDGAVAPCAWSSSGYGRWGRGGNRGHPSAGAVGTPGAVRQRRRRRWLAGASAPGRPAPLQAVRGIASWHVPRQPGLEAPCFVERAPVVDGLAVAAPQVAHLEAGFRASVMFMWAALLAGINRLDKGR
jgi:hypothetical protein